MRSIKFLATWLGQSRRRRSGRMPVAIGVLCTMAQPGFAAAHCLEYQSVSLSGTLVRQIHAGPPDYESVTHGDAPIAIWVLQLDRPICVYSSPGYARVYAEREVQLVFESDRYEQHRNLLMSEVVVSGELLPGGGRHHKRLVIAAHAIKKAQMPSDRKQDPYR